MTDLAELKRLHAAATREPWSISRGGPCGVYGDGTRYICGTNTVGYGNENRINAKCIVALHNAFPALAAEIEALRSFAVAMFEATDWPDGGDVDGFHFQDLAVKHGLLIPEQRTEPCGESCGCIEYHGLNGMKDGFTCYRKAPWLMALAQSEGGGE